MQVIGEERTGATARVGAQDRASGQVDQEWQYQQPEQQGGEHPEGAAARVQDMRHDAIVRVRRTGCKSSL